MAETEPKSYIRTVKSGDERLRFLAVAAKKGWSFYVQRQEVKDKKTKTLEKGASQLFADMAAAQKAVDEGVDAAKKLGWEESAGRGGAAFVAKEDSFSLSSLPKPKTVAAQPATAAAPQAQKPKGGPAPKA